MVVASCGPASPFSCGPAGFPPLMALTLWAGFALACGVVLLVEAGAFALSLRRRRGAWRLWMTLLPAVVGLLALALANYAWAAHQHFAALGASNDTNDLSGSPALTDAMTATLAPIGVLGVMMVALTIVLLLTGMLYFTSRAPRDAARRAEARASMM